MPDLPHHPSRRQRGTEVALASRRPRPQSGEVVEGWVIAEITPYPLRLRPVSHTNVSQGVESFPVGPAHALLEYYAAQYAPPAAQFVLAVVEYPSGPVGHWGRLHWPAIEIVLRSAQEWPAQEESAPPDTPELRLLVDELAGEALANGWEAAGRGRTWCSLRFRQRYDSLAGLLRWK